MDIVSSALRLADGLVASVEDMAVLGLHASAHPSSAVDMATGVMDVAPGTAAITETISKTEIGPSTITVGPSTTTIEMSTVSIKTKTKTEITRSAAPTATTITNSTRSASTAETTKAAKDCPVWQQCLDALRHILPADFALKENREESADKCFCPDCHKSRGDEIVYDRGGENYVLPVGYARVELKPAKTHAYKDTGLKKWHACFHGTKHEYIADLLKTGHLLTPGSHTLSGDQIEIREGHIDESVPRKNEHTGEWEKFDPTDKIFFSPSIRYCAFENVYMNEKMVSGKMYRFGFQVRLQPGTYDIGQQTVQPDGSDYPIDPHWPNSRIEWYTKQVHTHFFTGILIGENQTVSLADLYVSQETRHDLLEAASDVLQKLHELMKVSEPSS